MISSVISSVVATLAIAAASPSPAGAETHAGAVRSLIVQGDIAVRVEVDKTRPASVVLPPLTGPAAVVDVRFVGDALHATAPPQMDGPTPTIVVTTDHLASVTATGTAHVDARGIAGRPVDVRTAGTAVVSLAGKSSTLTIDARGTSLVDAARLAAASAEVTLTDAARADIKASSVSCDLRRASRLVVRGKPAQMKKKVAGVAKLTIAP